MSSSAAPEALEVQVLIVTVVFERTGYYIFTTVNLHYLIGLITLCWFATILSPQAWNLPNLVAELLRC